MASISPHNFVNGDICMYREQLCIVQSIQHSPLGFNKYIISNVDTGDEFSVAKHELSTVEVEYVSDIPEMNWEAELKEQEIPQASSSRHAVLSDADIDSVAKERLSANTEYQTKWAVTLFKGEENTGVNNKN
jgi:hypothetical protein